MIRRKSLSIFDLMAIQNLMVNVIFLNMMVSAYNEFYNKSYFLYEKKLISLDKVVITTIVLIKTVTQLTIFCQKERTILNVIAFTSNMEP